MVVVRVSPVASLFSVTVAPGTTAPLGSVTVPVRSPDTSDYAIKDGAITAATTSRARNPMINLFVVISPLKLRDCMSPIRLKNLSPVLGLAII